MWRYVAVPVSPRKTKKVIFFNFFSFWWRHVEICGGTGIATEKKSVFFLPVFLLVARCGIMCPFFFLVKFKPSVSFGGDA